MKRRQREAVVAALDTKLAALGSWCGETHLQKSVYFLQALLGVPTDFEYTLYKYGPFSRELRGELGTMRADGFLELVPRPPYGPTLSVTEGAERQLFDRWPRTLRRYDSELEFVADQLAPLGVGSLERLATALWVSTEGPDPDDAERTARIHELKPHVSLSQAEDAVQRVEDMRRSAVGLRLLPSS